MFAKQTPQQPFQPPNQITFQMRSPSKHQIKQTRPTGRDPEIVTTPNRLLRASSHLKNFKKYLAQKPFRKPLSSRRYTRKNPRKNTSDVEHSSKRITSLWGYIQGSDPPFSNEKNNSRRLWRKSSVSQKKGSADPSSCRGTRHGESQVCRNITELAVKSPSNE